MMDVVLAVVCSDQLLVVMHAERNYLVDQLKEVVVLLLFLFLLFALVVLLSSLLVIV